MKNSIYLAIGNGGGRWTETKGKPILSFVKDGQIDWDAVGQANLSADNSYLPAGAPEGKAAANMLSDFIQCHITDVGAV